MKLDSDKPSYSSSAGRSSNLSSEQCPNQIYAPFQNAALRSWARHSLHGLFLITFGRDLEKIQDLVGVHGGETRVLLSDYGARNIELESL